MPVAVWWILALLVVVEAVLEVFPVDVSAQVADWTHNVVLASATALCLIRAADGDVLRGAWLLFGVGLACWTLGSVLWSVLYDSDPSPPYPTVSDALWLAWYPITALGIGLLVRVRVPRFELHRWMDGLAVMLIVLTAASAALLQPVAAGSRDTAWATAVDFSYPILDMLMVGGILGVYGLLGWRPGRTWLLLGLGCAGMGVADAVFAVQQARGDLLDGDYDFIWAAGALIIAVAAWSSAPGPGAHEEVYGWRAVALPMGAQLLAGGIQVYGLFAELGKSERLVTLVVLAIATVQIVVSRPRRPG